MNIKDTYFGARMCVIALLVITLIVTIVSATSTKVIFSSILLFLLPMVLDYYSQIPVLKKNINRKELLLWISAIGSTITIIFLLTMGEKELTAGFNWWKAILSLIFIGYISVAIMDWIGYSSSQEVENRKQMQKVAQTRARKQNTAEKINSNAPTTN